MYHLVSDTNAGVNHAEGDNGILCDNALVRWHLHRVAAMEAGDLLTFLTRPYRDVEAYYSCGDCVRGLSRYLVSGV